MGQSCWIKRGWKSLSLMLVTCCSTFIVCCTHLHYVCVPVSCQPEPQVGLQYTSPNWKNVVSRVLPCVWKCLLSSLKRERRFEHWALSLSLSVCFNRSWCGWSHWVNTMSHCDERTQLQHLNLYVAVAMLSLPPFLSLWQLQHNVPSLFVLQISPIQGACKGTQHV